jgi:hypothetical protein
MEKRSLKPYLTVIGLMTITSLALAFTVDVTITDEAGIKVELPDQIADWVGEEVRFCHNRTCRREFLSGQLEDHDTCPACGEGLHGMSRAEYDMLPKDTILLKKKYYRSDGESVFVSIVLSGKERASIHRPQVCLVGQGREIVDTTVMDVPIEGRKPLGVTVLDLLTRPRGGNPEKNLKYTYYAYWFVGKGRETPSHVMRMIWMATDRIFLNVAHRWAYISVSGTREKGSDAYRDQIASFIALLYPEMALRDSA